MGTTRFADLIRSLSTAASRRGLLTDLTRGLLAAQSFWPLSGEEAAAKNKRRRRQKRRTNTRKRNQCSPDCAGRTCGDDGCGGSCNACPGGSHCLSNDSCATDCFTSDACSPGCTCGLPNTEGESNCIASVGQCATQPCQSTAECPLGTHCQPCLIETGPTFCFALCSG
jgi:hypothetical protein